MTHLRHWLFFQCRSRLLRCGSCRALGIWAPDTAVVVSCNWGNYLCCGAQRTTVQVDIHTSVAADLVSCHASASFDLFVFLPSLSADLRCFLDCFGRSVGRSAALHFEPRNGVRNFRALFAGGALSRMKSDPDDSVDCCDDGPRTSAPWIPFLRAPASLRLCCLANRYCAVVARSAAAIRSDCSISDLKRSWTLA